MTEDETVIMDEGTSIESEVKFIKQINSRLSLIEDEDGDQWEVETERLTQIIND